jgi:hypothetical protein
MRVDHRGVSWCLKSLMEASATQHCGALPFRGTTHCGALLVVLVVLDLKARGDGGVAERLHASSRHVLALLEVEGGERTEAAQSLQRLVGDVGLAERRKAAYCSQPLLRHVVAPADVELGEGKEGCAVLEIPPPSC